MSATVEPPAGFSPAVTSSPFLELIGPVWLREAGGELELAMIMDARHANTRGDVHGGVLAAFADVALVRATTLSQEHHVRLATASLSIDYAGAVKVGETVIATVDVQRVGRRLAYANCYLSCDGRRVVRASAVMAAVE